MRTVTSFDELVARAHSLAERPGRSILGIAGAPGAGKTTLAEAVVARLATEHPAVAHVPMDGFHLADVQLARLGRLDRKGAPDTFDADGYVALLARLTTELDTTIYAPTFERSLEQPVAGAIAVLPECRLVVTEGNYLLLPERPWQRARAVIDEVWYCRLDDHTRDRRLVDRHVRFGKTEEAARAWVRAVDEPNARRIAETADRADLWVDPAAMTH